MINKKYRLQKNYEFNHVYRKGTSVGCRCIVIYSVKNRNNTTKIGFSVSKKIGKSVKRNRAKRLMREAVRNCMCLFNEGYNYIVVAKMIINNSSYKDIENSVSYLLKKKEK